MSKFSPVGWFINNETAKHYISLIDRMARFSSYKQSAFKQAVRKSFEDRMFGDYDDHSEYYLNIQELDEIFKKFDK